MNIEISTILRKLPNNNVIVLEKNKKNQNQIQEKYYLVNQEVADKFIKTKEQNEFADNFQKGLTVAASGSMGYLISLNSKSSNLFIKLGTGIIGAVGSFVGFSAIDKTLDKFLNKTAMKKFNVKEITKEEIDNLIKAEEEKSTEKAE